MARKARPTIKILTNGTHKGTKLYINENEVPFEALSLNGDKNIDYDLVIGITQSKASKEAAKQAVGPDAIGFGVPDECYDDDEEYDE